MSSEDSPDSQSDLNDLTEDLTDEEAEDLRDEVEKLQQTADRLRQEMREIRGGLPDSFILRPRYEGAFLAMLALSYLVTAILMCWFAYDLSSRDVIRPFLWSVMSFNLGLLLASGCLRVWPRQQHLRQFDWWQRGLMLAFQLAAFFIHFVAPVLLISELVLRLREEQQQTRAARWLTSACGDRVVPITSRNGTRETLQL